MGTDDLCAEEVDRLFHKQTRRSVGRARLVTKNFQEARCRWILKGNSADQFNLPPAGKVLSSRLYAGVRQIDVTDLEVTADVPTTVLADWDQCDGSGAGVGSETATLRAPDKLSRAAAVEGHDDVRIERWQHVVQLAVPPSLRQSCVTGKDRFADRRGAVEDRAHSSHRFNAAERGRLKNLK